MENQEMEKRLESMREKQDRIQKRLDALEGTIQSMRKYLERMVEKNEEV